MEQVPLWWSSKDESHLKSFYAIEASVEAYPSIQDSDDELEQLRLEEFLESLDYSVMNECRCRRCYFWDSGDGKWGDCKSPELSPRETPGGSGCECWYPKFKETL